MKETFIIRTEWYEAISELSVKDQAIIFNNLFLYHMNLPEKINTHGIAVKLVWKLIEPNLKRNIENYDKRKDTSVENGKKGGRPKKEENEEIDKLPDENNLNNLKKPNEKPNENEKPNAKTKKPNETLSVSDTVTDSVSVNESAYDTDKAKKAFLNNKIFIEQFCMTQNVKPDILKIMQKSFLDSCDLRGKPVEDYRSYFMGCWDKGKIKIPEIKESRQPILPNNDY